MHMPSETSSDAATTATAITFVGGGNMARSLIGGLVAHGQDPATIHVAEPNEPLRDALARDFSVHVHADTAEAARHGSVWVFAVKPQVMHSVAQTLRATAQKQRPLLISIAAGITSSQLETWLGGQLPVVRTMPNTPSLLGAGAAGLFANPLVSSQQRQIADELLKATGLTVWIEDEAQMDAVTALSGSGPAYIFLLAEAMQAAGQAQGLGEDAARLLALQTIYGAARMLHESSEPAAELRKRVTSPGGTTEAAIASFESGGFHELVASAIAAATQRGRDLSAANDSATP
jgi:pyrroline-5-carboxylate reductase